MPLNNQQRKMLEKLYDERFKAEKNNFKTKRNLEKDKLVDKLNKEVAKKYATVLKKGEELRKLLDEISGDDTVSVRGVSFYEKDAFTVTINQSPVYRNGEYHEASKEIEEFDGVTRDKLIAIENARLQVLTDIYGLDKTYDEIVKHVEDIVTKALK